MKWVLLEKYKDYLSAEVISSIITTNKPIIVASGGAEVATIIV